MTRIEPLHDPQRIEQDIYAIVDLINDYRNESVPKGDWQPKENPDFSKGEYGYKDSQKHCLEMIVALIKRLPHD